MGIFDSLKKALGSKAEDETDETTAEAPVPAGEEPAEQELAPSSPKRRQQSTAATRSSQAIPCGVSLNPCTVTAQSIRKYSMPIPISWNNRTGYSRDRSC